MPSAERAEGAIRIATYNIHKGVSALSWRNRIHDLRESLKALNADIVFLQEVQGRSERHAKRFANWPDAPQHHYLASDVWTHSVYGKNAVRADGDHGNALLSSFPLLSHHNLDVSDHRFESRGVLHCELDLGGTQVHCICAHLGLFEDSRRRQVAAMIDRIRATVPDNAPLVIAGDFNDWRNSLGGMLSDGLGVREVFELVPKAPSERHWLMPAPVQTLWKANRTSNPARTFPAAFPLLRLDRVYVRGLRVHEAAVMHGRGWHKLSDHAPIVTDLMLTA